MTTSRKVHFNIRMKAVAGVVAMCIGAMARAGMQNESNNIDPEKLRQTLQFAAHARTAEARGERPIMTNILDALPEAAEYYKTPVGHHTRCTNEQLARSVELMLNYDPFAFIDWISPRPLLMIIGTGRHKVFNTTPDSLKAYECAKEPKKLLTAEGKKYIDLSSDTSESIPKLVEFVNKWLCF